MATQLKMFEGVRGNKLGESFRRSEPVDGHGAEQPLELDFATALELDELLENETDAIEEFSDQDFSLPDATEAFDPALPIENLLPPPAQPIPSQSETNISEAHLNPYEPGSHASVWKRIRSFFLDGNEE